MPEARRTIEGEVALVLGAEGGAGRSIALRLAAAGVRVVAAGPDERAVARVVGEIVCGGGTARHFAGDMRDAAHLDAALQKALEAFGKLTFLVAMQSQTMDVTALSARARPHLGSSGLCLLVPAGADEERAAEAVAHACQRDATTEVIHVDVT